jgi:hypothetical protein
MQMLSNQPPHGSFTLLPRRLLAFSFSVLPAVLAQLRNFRRRETAATLQFHAVPHSLRSPVCR